MHGVNPTSTKRWIAGLAQTLIDRVAKGRDHQPATSPKTIKAEILRRFEQLKKLPSSTRNGVPMGRWSKLKSMSAADWMFYHQTQVLGCPTLGTPRKKTQAKWMGVNMWKSPLDLQIYQEIIFEKRPDVIVELGTKAGGSTLFMAHMLDIIAHGSIVGVDLSPLPVQHPRITAITGDIASDEVFEKIRAQCHGKVMVVHDAAHDTESVGRDLKKYSSLVSEGQYFIVEDGMSDYFSLETGKHNPGPLLAISRFMKNNGEFRIDTKRERYLLTHNPAGYLLRVAQGGSSDQLSNGSPDGS